VAILVDKDTRLIVQGITGTEGSYHARACRDYGTIVVGGVTPGKGGSSLDAMPVFDSVREARQATSANASVIFVPPPLAADAILEALDAGIELIVCITEGIPVMDMVKVKRVLSSYTGSRLVGPNCPGVISPGFAKIGIMPGAIHSPGRVGVISRSGTLMYEAVSQLGAQSLGQSSCIGIGGDPIVGTSFVDALELFEADPETGAILLIGEIGGEGEEEAAAYISSSVTKPVAAFIAGRAAPQGRRMGHAGAISRGSSGSAAAKAEVLRRAGVKVTDDPARIGRTVRDMLSETKGAL
jgi:succinyl-CoA synthetase alpha subunit